ncbi:hypothetical protein [Streptomyces sp. NPDC047434]
MTTYAAALVLLTTAFADDRGPVAGETAPAELLGRPREHGTSGTAAPGHGVPLDGSGPSDGAPAVPR